MWGHREDDHEMWEITGIAPRRVAARGEVMEWGGRVRSGDNVACLNAFVFV